MQPWEAHSDLTAERLQLIATIARKVWKRARRTFSAEQGDTMWGFGTRFNERMRHALVLASEQAPWLRPVLRRLHFVFTIGAVPARFYRGLAARPKPNYLRRSTIEREQHQLAFPFGREEWVYRFAIEAAAAADIPEVYLVQHSATTGEVGQKWRIDRTMGRSQPSIELTASTSGLPTLREPVAIGAPTVTRKQRRKAIAANDS